MKSKAYLGKCFPSGPCITYKSASSVDVEHSWHVTFINRLGKNIQLLLLIKTLILAYVLSNFHCMLRAVGNYLIIPKKKGEVCFPRIAVKCST